MGFNVKYYKLDENNDYQINLEDLSNKIDERTK
jgi:aspartate/methionine/tyrosine aminotransferase